MPYPWRRLKKQQVSKFNFEDFYVSFVYKRNVFDFLALQLKRHYPSDILSDFFNSLYKTISWIHTVRIFKT